MNLTPYAKHVLETAETFSGKERHDYIIRKINELDNHIELGLLLGTPVNEANKSLEQIFEKEILTALP